MSDAYAVFLSYPPSAYKPARQFADALNRLGIACAPSSAPPRARQDTDLPPELPRAQLFVAWGSEDFFHSRGCQIQLAAAYLSDPRRILLLNPESGLKHIYPLSLRDLWLVAAPSPADIPALAAQIRSFCADHTGELGRPQPPRWQTALGGNPPLPARFERRERELWDIHAALQSPHTGEPLAVVVSGQAGQGKSLLAREYALRFGAAYPGGMFWLEASAARPAVSVTELAENPALKYQLLNLLRPESGEIDSVPDLLTRLSAKLEQAGQPYLWIVDGLPEGLNGPAFAQWLAPPGTLGRSLVTTRATCYDEKAESIHLPSLDPDTAYRLLIRELPPNSDQERGYAQSLVAACERNTQALSLANAALKADRQHRRAPYTALCNRLQDPYREALSIARQFSEAPPENHDVGRVATVLAGIALVHDTGRDLLRLAALLAEAPLPVDMLTACLIGSGLYAPPRYTYRWQNLCADLWRRHRPQEAAQVAQHLAAGLASLERLALGERRQGWLMVTPLATRVMGYIDRDRTRPLALRRAAAQLLRELAEHCADNGDWHAFIPLADHARALIGDLKDSEDSPAMLGHRTRLAMLLGDLDSRNGLGQQALQSYRAACIGWVRLIKALPAEARDSRWQLAVCRERVGDLLLAQGETAEAVESYSKSLAIRQRLAVQDQPAERAALATSHAKLGRASESDPTAALAYYHQARDILVAGAENPALTGNWAWLGERITILETPPAPDPAPSPEPEADTATSDQDPAAEPTINPTP